VTDELSEHDLEWFRAELETYVQDFLSNRENYPVDPESGKTMFFDDSETVFHSRKGWIYSKPRDASHLAENWKVSVEMVKDEPIITLNNTKRVHGKGGDWLLVGEDTTVSSTKGILTDGSNYYDSKINKTKSMNFYDRYSGLWNFNRYGRKGVGADKVEAFDLLLEDAVHSGMVSTAMKLLNRKGVA
jgi:hypothetical protein